MAQVLSKALARLALDALLPLADSRIEYSRRPFDGVPGLLPHVGSRRWAWTHFGVFVPSLPDPHRFLNVMTLIGTTGTEIFDNATVAAADVRDNTTLLSATAVDDQYHYRAYDARRDCRFAADGSSLAWGEDLSVEVAAGQVTVSGRYEGFAIDLDLTVTDQVSYFVRTPVYDHLSLLAPYTGTITDAAGTVTPISGLGTFEYARSMSHQALRAKPLSEALKLPADFFTYQIVQVDERTQLLLTEVRARGRLACRLIHLRVLGASTEVFDDVDFEVLEYGTERVDPTGASMPVPHRFAWTAREHGTTVVRVEATVHPVLRYGHGQGYVGSYDYTGQLHDRAITGTGYLEWVDVQR